MPLQENDDDRKFKESHLLEATVELCRQGGNPSPKDLQNCMTWVAGVLLGRQSIAERPPKVYDVGCWSAPGEAIHRRKTFKLYDVGCWSAPEEAIHRQKTS